MARRLGVRIRPVALVTALSSLVMMIGPVPAAHAAVHASGRVTDAQGTAVAGASVLFLGSAGPPGFNTTTRSDGTYSLALGAYSQTYTVQASALGYDSARVATPLVVSDGMTLTDIDLRFPAAASITGRVVDRAGAAIGGATVTTYSPALLPPISVTTRSDGTYTLGGLTSGELYVTAAKAGFAPAQFGGQPASSVVLAVSGAATGVDMTMVAGSTISGRVLGPAGPVAAATVRLTAVSPVGQVVADVVTTATGEYRFADVDGRFNLLVLPPSPLAPEAADLTLPRGDDVFDLTNGVTIGSADVHVGPPAEIRGVVTVAGRSVQGVLVTAFNSAGWSASARSDVDGSYALTGLPIGTHLLHFDGPVEAVDEYYLHATDAAQATPVVTDNSTVLTVNNDLAAATIVRGVVTDPAGQSVVGATVIGRLVGGERVARATTEFDGSYLLDGLAVGGWLIDIVPPLDRDLATAVLPPIMVTAGQQPRRDVSLGRGYRVGFQVYGADGVLDEGARADAVVCPAPSMPAAGGEYGSCSDGRRSLPQSNLWSAKTMRGLAAGTYNVAGFDRGEQRVTGAVSLTVPAAVSPFTCTFRFGGQAACSGPPDVTPPVVICPAIPNVVLGAAGQFAYATVNDDGVISTVKRALVSSKVGPYSLKFSAADATGNVGTATCSYRVVYAYSGWGTSASGSLPRLSVSVGKMLRVDWMLRTAAGAPVTDPRAFTRIVVAAHPCFVGAKEVAAPLTTTPGLVVKTDGSYRYGWKPATDRGCATLTIVLNDGTRHVGEIRVV